MHSAIKTIVTKVSDLSLREIHLVSHDPETTAYIQTIFRQLLEYDFEHDDASRMLPGNLAALEKDNKSNLELHRKPVAGIIDTEEPDEQSGDEEELHGSQLDRKITEQPVTGDVVNEHTMVQQPARTVGNIASAAAECGDEEELPGHNPRHAEETELANRYSDSGPVFADESRDRISRAVNESISGTLSRDEAVTTAKTESLQLFGE